MAYPQPPAWHEPGENATGAMPIGNGDLGVKLSGMPMRPSSALPVTAGGTQVSENAWLRRYSWGLVPKRWRNAADRRAALEKCS